MIPSYPGFRYSIAQGRVRRLEQELEALDNAKGGDVFQGTPVGRAAIAWSDARGEWARCLARAEGAGPRERHQLRKQAKRAAEREGPWRDEFARLAAPERARIKAELPDAKKVLEELEGQHHGHLHFQMAHPEALRRLVRLDRDIATAAFDMDVERQDLDGIAPRRPEVPKADRGLVREQVLERGMGMEL